MKLNKLFASAMCVATLAMIACQKQTPTVIPPTGGEEEEEVIPPVVAAPGEGKTTLVVYVPKNTSDKGLYAIGSMTDNWKEHNKEGFRFSKVEGDETGRWYQLTMDYDADMQMKVCAIPANSAPGWNFQWAKNMDPGNDLTEDNVILLQGQLTLVLENGGEPKATKFADN